MKYAVTKTIRLNLPCPDVFARLTDGQQLAALWPLDDCQIGSAVGDPVTLRGQDANGEFTDHGVITQLDPPSVFAYRYWSTNHGTERNDENMMTIVYRLRDTDDAGTELRVDHANLLTPERQELMATVWDQLLPMLSASLDKPVSG